MGDDSGGVPVQQTPSSNDKICITVGCGNVVTATGPGNHKYCNSCKLARSSPGPSALNKTKNKRDNTVLSPIETSQTKLSRDDDSFAFAFNDVFGIDFDAFVGLSKQELIDIFKSHFSRINDAAESSRCEINRLTDQIQSLASKLNIAKLAIADKHIQSFENSLSTGKTGPATKPPVAPLSITPTATIVADGKINSNQNSFANIVKGPSSVPRISPRPILIARIDKNAPASFVTEEKIDALLFSNKAPTVQQVKRSENHESFCRFEMRPLEIKLKSYFHKTGNKTCSSLFLLHIKPFPALFASMVWMESR